MGVQRVVASGPARRRWEKSRDADETYLDEPTWNRIWARAVADSGIPFKPTAYQLRHTHASRLIDVWICLIEGVVLLDFIHRRA